MRGPQFAARAACGGNLRSEIPAFTKLLAPGLGLAEDRGREESFGTHRCHLLAEGIIESHQRRIRRFEERMSVVERRFCEAGIDLDSPYLEPGSHGSYALHSTT